MTVNFFLCAASGKKCDRKRKIKDEIALKISFFCVGTIQICSLFERERMHVHSELRANISYNLPASLSVVCPALDLVPTNLLLVLFLAETRVQLALSSDVRLSDASAMLGKYALFQRIRNV